MPNVTAGRKHVEFNTVLLEAFDQAICEMLGATVLQALYDRLAKRDDVSRDELPYRLETAFEQLEQVFGVKGAKTIGRAIAIWSNIATKLTEKGTAVFSGCAWSEMSPEPLRIANGGSDSVSDLYEGVSWEIDSLIFRSLELFTFVLVGVCNLVE